MPRSSDDCRFCARTASARFRFGGSSTRGMTLVELLIAMSILAMVGLLVFGAVDGMRRSRAGVERISNRYREGRLAVARMNRELQSAYLSAHAPIDESLRVVQTAFVGEPGVRGSRLDFNSFAGRRLRRNERKSDQMEVAYFTAEDDEGVLNLVRREAPPDEEPGEGGRLEILATDVDHFEIEYLDPLSGRWREEWDSTSVVGEKGRLPLHVRLFLVLNGAERSHSGGSRGKVRLRSQVELPIQDTLTFAVK